MQLFYLDEPLGEAELSELRSILLRSDWIDDQREIVQHPVPVLLPLPDPEVDYGAGLSRCVERIRKQLVRAGVAPRGDEVIALVKPKQPMQAAGVLALALGEVAGRAPYLVVSGDDRGPGVRLVNVPGLIRWLQIGTGGRPSAGPRRAHPLHPK